MDPVSSIGLASSLVQLITFTTSVINHSRKMYHSASGSLVENDELAMVALTCELQNKRISALFSNPGPQTETTKHLLELCDDMQNISQDLLSVIKSLKVSGDNRRWESFRQALRSVKKEQDINDLVRRLDRYRQQVDTILLLDLQERLETPDQKNLTKPRPGNLHEFRKSMKSEREQLEADIKRQEAPPKETEAERLAKVEKNLAKSLERLPPGSKWHKDLLETTRDILRSPDAVTEIEFAQISTSLSAGARQEYDTFLKRRILESLCFSDMKDRYETISLAHKKTFDWVFQEPNSQEQARQIWDSYANWLKSTQPVYWITGKPGSGKSTLMRYLSDHEMLQKYLKSWHGESTLCMARFFFWNSGTALQMSRIGLLRSLLYQVLTQCPDEIPRLFPDRWQFREYFSYDYRPWDWSELSDALKKLVNKQEKFFIFLIDGLDEFDGDGAELSEFLLELVSASPNVKLSVASRPWPVFEDAFRRQPSLRMEDLTSVDVALFVTDKLAESYMFSRLQELDPSSADTLIETVTGMSSGVFLWVVLVVRSLIEGLRDGDTIKDLYSRLLLLPKDLEALFEKMLGNLEPAHAEQASQIFQVVRASHVPSRTIDLAVGAPVEGHNDSQMRIRDQEGNSQSPLTLLTLSFIGEDTEGALSAEESEDLTDEQQCLRSELVRRRLSSRCKGLLEAPAFKTQRSHTAVQYLHRTVKDFLDEDRARSILGVDAALRFDPHSVLCASLLRHVRAISQHNPNMMHIRILLLQFVTQCLWMEVNGYGQYVPYLRDIDKVTESLFGKGPTHWTKKIDSYAAQNYEVFSLFDYAVVRSLTHYVKASLADGYSLAPNPNARYLVEIAVSKLPPDLATLLSSVKLDEPRKTKANWRRPHLPPTMSGEGASRLGFRSPGIELQNFRLAGQSAPYGEADRLRNKVKVWAHKGLNFGNN